MKKKKPWIVGILMTSIVLLFGGTVFLASSLGGGYFLTDSTDNSFDGKTTNPVSIPCDSSLLGCRKEFSLSCSDGEGGEGGASQDCGDYRNNAIFTRIVPRFISWIIGIAGGSAVLIAIIAGIMMMMAGVQEDMNDKAKKTLTYAIVGILLSSFSYLIVELINRLPFPS